MPVCPGPWSSALAPKGGETCEAELELKSDVGGSAVGAPYLSLGLGLAIALIVVVVPGAPRPGRLECRDGGCLLLFSLSNKITSYGDRYPEGRTEESKSRSIMIKGDGSIYSQGGGSILVSVRGTVFSPCRFSRGQQHGAAALHHTAAAGDRAAYPEPPERLQPPAARMELLEPLRLRRDRAGRESTCTKISSPAPSTA